MNFLLFMRRPYYYETFSRNNTIFSDLWQKKPPVIIFTGDSLSI